MIDDSVTTCDCCGKSGLKFTVLIELNCGEVVNYGSVCATRNTGKTRPAINVEIRKADADRKTAARTEFRAHPAYLAEHARFAERLRIAPALIGMKAAEFVREVSGAADAACKEIAARHRVHYWDVRNG